MLLPIIGLDHIREKYQNRRARTFPKVTRRKRALSLPKNDNSSPLSGRTAPQTNSLLFKLPAELRTVIYKEVVGKGRIHIILVDTHKGHWKLRSYRCPARPRPHAENGDLNRCFTSEGEFCFSETHDINRPGVGVMGLLQSCRGTYSEVIDILYMGPTFALHDYASVLAFTSSLLPNRFNAIRSLHFCQRDITVLRPSDYDFYENNNFNHIRQLTIYNPILPSGYVVSRDLSSFWLVTEILFRMAALEELYIDLALPWPFSHESDKCRILAGMKPYREVDAAMEMLREMVLKGVAISVTFERVDETAHWATVPFIQSFCES